MCDVSGCDCNLYIHTAIFNPQKNIFIYHFFFGDTDILPDNKIGMLPGTCYERTREYARNCLPPPQRHTYTAARRTAERILAMLCDDSAPALIAQIV